jgi:hypothetical protein
MDARVRKDTLSSIRGFVAKTVGKFKVRGRAYAQCQWQSTSLIGEESNDSWPIARYIWRVTLSPLPDGGELERGRF